MVLYTFSFSTGLHCYQFTVKMLLNILYASYKQYKLDKKDVITCLADIAQRCGYQHHLLTKSAPTQPKASKSKGKARIRTRQTKENFFSGCQGKNVSIKPTPGSPKYLVTSKDLISWAEWIANSTKAHIVMPACLVNLMK